MSCYILCDLNVCVQSEKTSSSLPMLSVPKSKQTTSKIACGKKCMVQLCLCVRALVRISLKFLRKKFVRFFWGQMDDRQLECSDDIPTSNISSTASVFFPSLALISLKWTNFSTANFELPTNQIKSKHTNTHTRAHTLSEKKSTLKFLHIYLFIFNQNICVCVCVRIYCASSCLSTFGQVISCVHSTFFPLLFPALSLSNNLLVFCVFVEFKRPKRVLRNSVW